MITVTGNASWHGSQHKKSSYTASLPIMGLFIQVFPFNHHTEARKFSIAMQGEDIIFLRLGAE
jgi:hypothetical protein